jgi:hypothetical protein
MARTKTTALLTVEEQTRCAQTAQSGLLKDARRRFETFERIPAQPVELSLLVNNFG